MTPIGALQVLDHAIDELGMAGIHILSNIDGMPLDDPNLDPFWESATIEVCWSMYIRQSPTPHITTPTPCRTRCVSFVDPALSLAEDA